YASPYRCNTYRKARRVKQSSEAPGRARGLSSPPKRTKKLCSALAASSEACRRIFARLRIARGQKLTQGAGLGGATASWLQLVKQCLGLFQNGRIESLREPAVGRCEEIAGRVVLALLEPEPGKTDRGAQLPELRALLLRDADSLGKAALGNSRVLTA